MQNGLQFLPIALLDRAAQQLQLHRLPPQYDGYLQQYHLAWYQSSPDSRRGFCQTCGSTLFFQSKRWPGEIHIVRTALQAEVDIEPQAHSYWNTHVDWYDFKDDLPHSHD